MLDQITQLVEVKTCDWWKIKGLIIGMLAVIAVTAALQSIFRNSIISIIILALLSLIWVGSWLYKNRIRKIRKGTVGILICIYSKDPDVDKRIREDFITSLRISLSASNVNNFADILVVPYHIASRYESARDAQILLKKSNAHYLVFGLVRKRGQRDILDLTAHVRHAELGQESKQQFAKDISSAWVSRYNLDNAEENIELFEITSDIISLCSQYIIGLAAFASFDFSTSETLFVGVRNDIKAKHFPDLPAIRTIRISITHRVNQIYLHQARSFLMVWGKTEEKENIIIAQEILKKVYGAYKRDGEYLTLNAICEVLLHQNYAKARSLLNKIKSSKRDAIWYLNAGFIEACQNNETNASSYYLKAKEINESSEKPLTLEKISEFEEFIVWFRDKINPSPLLYYCLAFLNDYVKGDSQQALDDYQKFIDTSGTEQFTNTVETAHKRLSELAT